MIVIEITNTKDLVQNQKGWLTAQIGSLVTDLEAKVEAQIIEQLQESFAENGVRANIASVAGMTMIHVESGNDEWTIRPLSNDSQQAEA
jgi:hypothetical protein